MNKKYQKMLIDFMNAKANILKNNGIKTVYFDDIDKESIMNWNDVKSKNVWEDLWVHIYIANAKNLSGDTCLFCLFFSVEDQASQTCDDHVCLACSNGLNHVCLICSYGANHGICNSGHDSSYGILMEELTLEKNIYEDEIFSNVVYRKIIKEIEEKYT
jgi:hypothetical protein